MAKTRILEESERTSRLRTRLCAPSWNARWHSSISRGYLPPNNCIVNDRLARSDEKLVSKGAVHLRSCYHEEIRRVSNLQASNHCRNELFGGKKGWENRCTRILEILKYSLVNICAILLEKFWKNKRVRHLIEEVHGPLENVSTKQKIACDRATRLKGTTFLAVR